MDIHEYISSGIIEMYVMGLCSEEEKQEVKKLRREHAELDQAITRYEEELESRMMQEQTLPSAETDKKILSTLDDLQAPVVSMSNHQKKSSLWKYVAAASVILLLVSLYFNYTLYQQKEDAYISANGKVPPSDFQILNNPKITPVAMYGVGRHAICRCTMFWDKRTGKAYIMIHHLVPSQDDDYQLWAYVDGKPVNVGIVNDDIRGRFIEVQNVPEDATSFIVTRERAGGVQEPTIAETYLQGKLI